MKYLTGMFALNTPCPLDTTGDWHRLCYDWSNPEYAESDESLWGTYGIYFNENIPMLGTGGYVADHIRALLDMLSQGRFLEAQGMRNDYICNDSYNEIIFSKVIMLINNTNWDGVNAFMHREYPRKWRMFLKDKEV